MTQRADLSNRLNEMLDRRLRDLIESHPTPLVLLADDGTVFAMNQATQAFNLAWPDKLPIPQSHEGLVAGEAIPGFSTTIDTQEAFFETVIQHTSQRYDTHKGYSLSTNSWGNCAAACTCAAHEDLRRALLWMGTRCDKCFNHCGFASSGSAKAL